MWKISVVGIAAALLIAFVCRVVFEIDSIARIVAIAVLTTASVVAMLKLPVHALPGLALLLVAVVPTGLFPGGLPRSVTPASCVFGVWVVLRLLARDGRRRRRPSGAAAWIVVALLAWCAVSTATSVDLRTSVGWTVSLLVVIAPAVLLDSTREAKVLRRAWWMVAPALASYAVVESYAGDNVVFGSFPGVVDPQHWSSYRAVAAFGHPLAAGTFFAVSCALLAGDAVVSQGIRRTALALGAAVCSIAVLCTIARGSIVAVVLSLLVVGIAVTAFERHRFGRPLRVPEFSRRTTAVGAAIGVGFVASVWVAGDRVGAVIARSTSAEAAGSDGARFEGVEVALKGAAAWHWMGVGPGASQRAVDEFNTTGVPIENSFLQLFLSIGIPGLLLVTGLLVVAAIAPLGRRDWGALGAVTALSVSIATYNMIDARLSYHVLIGLVLMVALHSRADLPPQLSGKLPQRRDVSPEGRPQSR